MRVHRLRDALPSTAAPAGAFACAALLAACLDACPPLLGGAARDVRAFAVVALAGLLTALVRRRGRSAEALWRTPFDGLVAASVAVLVLGAAPWRGAAPDGTLLGFVVAAVGAYYALVALASKDARALEAVWRAFPLATALLGLHALWAATAGLVPLAAAAAAADARWAAPHALDSTLLVLTALTAGRASERGAPPAWRLAAIVGATGVALHAAAAGLPFEPAAMSRLEDPLAFSTAMVLALVLHRAGRTCWNLRRARRPEARRWWGAVVAVTLMGAQLLCGPGPAGEGVVALAALLSALVVTAAAAPVPGGQALPEEPPVPLARAA